MIESVKYIRFSKEQQHAAKNTTPKLTLHYKLMREKDFIPAKTDPTPRPAFSRKSGPGM